MINIVTTNNYRSFISIASASAASGPWVSWIAIMTINADSNSADANAIAIMMIAMMLMTLIMMIMIKQTRHNGDLRLSRLGAPGLGVPLVRGGA